MSEKIQRQHLVRKAMLYVRQSSAYQVSHNVESQALQYAMQGRLQQLGWREIEVVDDDLGRSAAGTVARTGFERMVAEVCLGKVGAVAAREVSRFARNNRDWQQLVEVCRVVDTVLIDQDTVYAPRHSNDRLLLGLKGSLNEYELDLLRQRSVDARRAKACRGELIVASPAGYLKTEAGQLEKDPDRRVQEAVRLVFHKFVELGTVRQTLSFAKTPSGGQVVDLSALIRTISELDDHPRAPPGSTPPVPLRRPPPARPGEPRLASAARRVQTIGASAQIAHDGSPLVGGAGQSLGRLEAGSGHRVARHGPAVAAPSLP